MSENDVNDRIMQKKKGDDEVDDCIMTKKGDQGDHGTENEGDVETKLKRIDTCNTIDDGMESSKVDNGISILKDINLDFFFKDGECRVNMHNYSLESRHSPCGTSGFVAVRYTVIILNVYTCM